MKLELEQDEVTIAEEVRAFLRDHLPAPDEIPTDLDGRVASLRRWQKLAHDAGLVGLSWPKEFGGRGLSIGCQIVANQELARAGAPELIGVIGLDIVGPTIVHYGTDEQKERFLPRILSAEDIWCQGFSEPNAGSDLASLRTSAEDRGDHFVVHGQKTWTSWAQYAKWCAVLVRTEPEGPPHRGISYLLVDMESPGIEVRPLVQITGDAEFGEVFFDEVEVPKENLLGGLNEGWRIAMTTLAHERSTFALGRQVKLRVLLDRLIEQARRVVREGAPASFVPEVRATLVRAYTEIEVLRHQAYRSVGTVLAKGQPTFDSSVDKLFLNDVEQRVCAAALEVLGAYAPLEDGSDFGIDGAFWQHAYFYSRAASIYGGSAQIQRNIVAERILGLPRS